MYREYIDINFRDYLNRHIRGIILLKNTLKKIHLGYELSEAFSNHTCRFLIAIDFHNFDSLSKAEKQIANECFHNMSNDTGSKFVSFSYKPQRSYNVDFNEINSFMTHYTFAKELIEGGISHVLPPTCDIEIQLLEEEPLFLYTDHFFNFIRQSKEKMEINYRELTGRNFDFDCMHHQILINAAGKYLDLAPENIVTDEELKKNTDCFVEDLRSLILDQNIPFNIRWYSKVIDSISIDMAELKNILQSYDFSRSYLRVNPSVIIKYIDQKEKKYSDQQLSMESISKEANIKIGDYIFAECDRWGTVCNDLGIIKKIHFDYKNRLEVEYALLNNDLKESKRALKETFVESILCSIPSSKVENENLKTKLQLISLMKRDGNQNKLFKAKKVKKK